MNPGLRVDTGYASTSAIRSTVRAFARRPVDCCRPTLGVKSIQATKSRLNPKNAEADGKCDDPILARQDKRGEYGKATGYIACLNLGIPASLLSGSC